MEANRQIESQTNKVTSTKAEGNQVCVLLASFKGSKTASKNRKAIGKKIKENGHYILNEQVIQVNDKRKVVFYDPRALLYGTLIPIFTWGLFGLISNGTLESVIIWGALGAFFGGLFYYYVIHLWTKNELKRIGKLATPDSSALLMFIHASDTQSILSIASAFQPTSVRAALINEDLTAQVQGDTPQQPTNNENSLFLSMLLFRYKGKRTAHDLLIQKGLNKKQVKKLVQVDLVFETNDKGKVNVNSPSQGPVATAKADLVSWGVFGVVFGAIAGLFSTGGVLGFFEGGILTGIGWGIFGLFAGMLMGYFANRTVTSSQVKGITSLLRPDSSLILAWADATAPPDEIDMFATPDSQHLILDFVAGKEGAVLEAK